MEDQRHDEESLRFSMELEFVSCLARPAYLQFLAEEGYFKDERFLKYLKYLLYWKRPAFPHGLYFLDLLQHEEFRRELLKPSFIDSLYQQQLFHWQFANSKHSEEQKEEQPE